MGGTSFLLEGEEHSVLCSPVGALRSQRWKGRRVDAKGTGSRQLCSPPGTVGVPKRPDSVLQPLLHGPSGLSCCPFHSAATEL